MIGVTGSCTCTTSKSPPSSARRARTYGVTVTATLETAPFIPPIPSERPSGTRYSGMGRCSGRAPACMRAARRSSGSNGASTETSWPVPMNCSASASMCRVTPPGYVQEYGETRAIRIRRILARRLPVSTAVFRLPSVSLTPVPERHFVKYTFLQVDPAWRRLDDEQRARDKQEFIAACEDFAGDPQHLLRAFSLVGTRGDADLMVLT